MLDRMTQGRWLWSLGCLSLCVPLSGCMKRSIGAADESALPREDRDAPQPAALKNSSKTRKLRPHRVCLSPTLPYQDVHAGAGQAGSCFR